LPAPTIVILFFIKPAENDKDIYTVYKTSVTMLTKKEWFKKINKLKTEKTLKNKNSIKGKLKETVIRAIGKNTPEKKFGIFFSGGIDSTLIAYVCKKNGADFICYSVGLENSKDLEWAKKTAKKLKLKLKTKTFSLDEAEKIIKNVAKILQTPDVVNVGVGCVVYSAAALAKKDNMNVFFSGLGSEEIFAGYERHAHAKNVNKECWKGLRNMHERDLIRDFKISQRLKIKILTPFLEDELIKFAMQIPGKYKINKENKKIILREIAEELGIPKEFAWRKKIAAQYGSGFDRAIKKLAKKNGFQYKKDYLEYLLRHSH